MEQDLSGGRLVVLGSHRSDVVPLGERTVVVGREPGAPRGDEEVVVLAGNDVSRRHCQVVPNGGRHWVRDLGSTNGLFVNDHRTRAAALEPFDRVRVGDYLLVYLDDHTDPDKVLGLMSRLEETSTFHFEERELDDELLSLVIGLPQVDAREPFLDSLLEELQRLLEAEALALVLVEGGGQGEQVRVLQGRGPLPESWTGERLTPLVAQALSQGAVHRQAGLLLPAGETVVLPLAHRPWTEQGEPCPIRTAVRGGLLLELPPGRPLSTRCETLLLALARQLAVLLSNAHLHRQATVDPLTGLSNRRALEPTLADLLAQAERSGAPLGVVLLDVDDFKRINDEHGHAAGDAVLRTLGSALARSLRSGDFAGRWGGEEFLALLPGTDLPGSVAVAQKLAAQVAADTSGAAELPGVTVSAGVAVFPDHGRTAELLVQRADEALYVAKRAGKACVRRYGDPNAEPADPRRTQRIYADRVRSAARPALATRAWLCNDLRAPLPLRQGSAISLGRSDACDVVLAFPTVSRLHAVVQVDSQGKMQLLDASSNGVRINGEPMPRDSVELRLGDRIQIGPYTFDVSEQHDGAGAETQVGHVVTGVLERGSLEELLLDLAASAATGWVVVSGGPEMGRIEMREGTLVRASLGVHRNEEALRALLALHAGTYHFTAQTVEGPAELRLSLPQILGQNRLLATRNDGTKARLERLESAEGR